MQSLLVDNDVELAYRDTGAPSDKTSYTTIFIIHGIVFNSGIFQKVFPIALKAGLRMVAITRRDYKHSTPFSPSDIAVLQTGTSEQKRDFLAARGREIDLFIDKFATTNNLPPISADRTSGGYALFGWSLGTIFALSAVANVDTLPEAVRERIGASLCANILYELPVGAIGLPIPPKSYQMFEDEHIPAEYRFPMYMQWTTSYFDHADLTKRDLDAISYVLPSTKRPPTIFNMTQAQYDDITEFTPAPMVSDMSLMLSFAPELMESCRKACYDKDARKLLPNLTISLCMGDSTGFYPIPAFWYLQDKDAALGGGHISHYKILENVNHYMHWDDPKEFVELIQECLH